MKRLLTAAAPSCSVPLCAFAGRRCSARAGGGPDSRRAAGCRPDRCPAIPNAPAQHRRVPRRRHGRDGHVGALPDRRGRSPVRYRSTTTTDAEHGAPGRARDPVQQLHGHERVFTDAHLDHDGPERRAAPDDELDRSGANNAMRRGLRLELARAHEGRGHAAVAAARRRLPYDPRRKGALRPERLGGRRSAESRVRRERRRACDRPSRELFRPGRVWQGRLARGAPPRALPRHGDVPHRCAHQRGRGARGRGGRRAAAVLSQHGPLRVHAPFQSDPRYAAHYAASGRPAPAQPSRP